MRSLLLLLVCAMGLGAAEPVNDMCLVTTYETAVDGITVTHEGTIYGFCCRSCVREFKQDPARYIAAFQQRRSTDGTDAEQRPAEDGPGHGVEEEQQSFDDDHSDHEQAGGLQQQVSDEGHDHSEHDQAARLLALVGRYHVVMVHFPIGLLLVAAVLAWIARPLRRPSLLAAGLITTHIGSISALLAAGLGWLLWTAVSYPQAEITFLLHQITGSGTAVLALTASFLAGWRLEEPTRPAAWRWCLLLTAVAVALAGYFGGELVYGPDYFLI